MRVGAKGSPELRKARLSRIRERAQALESETGVPAADILGLSRDRQVVALRHRLWAELHDTGLSYPVIAELVGCDHSSVRYGAQRARKGKVA